MPTYAATLACGLALVCAAAAPAFALDCTKAAAPDEKAICADPQALAADDAMVKAFQALYGKSSDADKKLLLASQRGWIKTRANSCADKSGAEQGRCLKDETEKRRKYLAGEPEGGPGSGGKLVPLIVQRAQRKAAYELDINAVHYVPATTAAENLFNSEVDRMLRNAPNIEEDYQAGLSYSYQLSVDVTYASPKFISAHISDYIFGGGAHGSGSTRNINIDAAKGVFLKFDDVFTAAGKAKIDAECMSQIVKQKSEQLDEGEKMSDEDMAQLRSGVEEGLHKLEKWSFSSGTATVTYDAYAIGSYAEGPHECEFTTQFLQPLAKAGFVVP
jgi:uncharacterized protein YecT (DUF1311 family)